MVRTLSTMNDLGTAAPDFRLPVANPGADGRDGDTRALGDFAEADALLVVFICNHCPYVHAVEDRLIALAEEAAERGIATVAISSNDAEAYPQDGFDAMAARAADKGYPFPYLYDESQEVARAYDAVCTPDFFLFDADRRLAYRGRLDDGRPNNEATTTDLRDAIDELLETGAVTGEQFPSMGCNIKWREAA